jgi:hypothetical protein
MMTAVIELYYTEVLHNPYPPSMYLESSLYVWCTYTWLSGSSSRKNLSLIAWGSCGRSCDSWWVLTTKRLKRSLWNDAPMYHSFLFSEISHWLHISIDVGWPWLLSDTVTVSFYVISFGNDRRCHGTKCVIICDLADHNNALLIATTNSSGRMMLLSPKSSSITLDYVRYMVSKKRRKNAIDVLRQTEYERFIVEKQWCDPHFFCTIEITTQTGISAQTFPNTNETLTMRSTYIAIFILHWMHGQSHGSIMVSSNRWPIPFGPIIESKISCKCRSSSLGHFLFRLSSHDFL